MSPHEATVQQFHQAMLALYWRVERAIGCWASYFLDGVRICGGLAYAKMLLSRRHTDSGFQRMIGEDRPDLLPEALVLDPRFSCLFTDAELAEAKRRLAPKQ